MFEFERVVEKLEDFKNLSERKQEKLLKKLLSDDEFTEWLFDSSKDKSNKPVTAKQVDRLYSALTKPRVLIALVNVIKDEGYDSFKRSHATFLYSICNFAIEVNNQRIEMISEDVSNGDLSKRDAKEAKAKLEKYSEIIADLLKCARKIVKQDAKQLSRETNLSRDLCQNAFWHVPDIEYVPAFKVGFYLNGLLNIIYDDAAEYGFGRKTPNWRTFFKTIFGKRNLPSAATFILLEGVNRIDKYKDLDSIDAVKDCWDSLTEFALKVLDEQPDEVRSQMVELYIKRVEKMFSNNSYDLRVNILSLPRQFKKLISTVSNYKDKLVAILNPDKKAA